MMDRVDSFRGDYAFLSNFWIESDGLTVEHRFQAAKTVVPDEKALVLAAATPAIAKRLGRKVALVGNWEEIKVEVMYGLLVEKFSDVNLALELEATGDAELVEGNTWGDTFWGVNTRTGAGANILGKLLMEVRSGIRRQIIS